MKTEILKIKGDWQEVLNDCRATVGKAELHKEPSDKFKRDIVRAEHSPIRDIEIKFRWRDIKYWVAMHWKTHTWQSRVDSQRNDRQEKYDRDKAPQDSPVTLTGEMNGQHTIDTQRKRLCYMASPETRELAEDFKYTCNSIDALKDFAFLVNMKEILCHDKCTSGMRYNVEYAICKYFNINYNETMHQYC